MTITTTTLLGGGMVSEILSGLVTEALYDPTSLRSIALQVPPGFGSTTSEVTIDAAPAAFTAPGETTAVTPAAYSTSEFELILAKYSRAYQITDLVGVSGSPINMQRIVANLIQGLELTLTEQMAATFSSFTAQEGNAATVLTVDDVMDASFALNLANNSGPYACVLSPKQMNEFKDDLRGQQNLMAYNMPSQEQLTGKGNGWQGSWNGIDLWQTSSVVTAAAVVSGAMMSQNAIAYQLGNVAQMQGHIPAANMIVNTPELVVELDRSALSGMSSAVVHAYIATAIANDSRGVEIVSLG
jgi:hypothetical protein